MRKIYCFIGLMAFALFQPAFSEESETRGLSQSSDLEKIEVTGSRIQRIDVEGPNPLVIYNKEDLENSGYASAGDFLRDTTISHFGVGREEAGSSLSGEAFASVKGQTSLILINGRRVVEDPGVAAVDLNLIPLAAIERVEILKDGASALYGSDAVGGVINFITKKNFSGMEFQGQLTPTVYSYYKGISKGKFSSVFEDNNWLSGSEGNLSAVFGDVHGKGSYIASFQIRFKDSIENFEREWTDKSITPTGPYGVFNGTVDPNCPPDNKTDFGCEFNVADHSTRYPQYAQAYAYFQGDYKSQSTTFYTQLIASYKNVQWSYAPIPGVLNVPAGHKMSFQTGQAGSLRYRFMEAGKRDTFYNTFIGDMTVGARGYLSSLWDYDFSVKLAHVMRGEKSEGLLLKDELLQSIVDGVYDPFNPEKRDLSSALYTAQSDNRSNLVLSSLDLSGEAGIWDIDLATGLQAYFKDYEEIADEKAKEGKILSNAGSDGTGSRYVASYYLEAIKYFSELLEVQAAGRVDYYSDFGWTGNPKLAFRFKPHSQFLLRGSVGTSFTAPSLHTLYQSDSEGFPSLFDTVACYNELKGKGSFNPVYGQLEAQSDEEKENFVKDFLIEQKEVINRKDLSSGVKTELEKLSKSFTDTNYCKYQQIFIRAKGNEKLKETKSLVASLGSHLQVYEGHNLTVDLWYIRNSGIPSSGISKKTLDAELKFGSEYVKEKGVTLNRDTEAEYQPLHRGPTHGMDTQLLNLGSSKISGLDLSWESDLKNIRIFNGSPYFTDVFSYIFFSSVEAFPGIGYTDGIGKFGAPPWRNILSLGWKSKKHNVALTAHTVSSFAKGSSELEDLPMYSRLDLDYQYVMNEKTSFKFGWSNLLFSTPPLDEGNDLDKLDHDIFEARGPFFFAGFKHKL